MFHQFTRSKMGKLLITCNSWGYSRSFSHNEFSSYNSDKRMAASDDYMVVASYATDKYTYFVGSASKTDIPLALKTGRHDRPQRLDIRAMRVCNMDGTRYFESSIEIALSCENLGVFNLYLEII